MEDLITYLKSHHLYRLSIVIAILAGMVVVKMVLSRLIGRYIDRSSKEIHNDPTNYKFLRHAVSALVYIVGVSCAIFVIPSLRTVAKSLLAGAGILAVAIGFASQHALSNIISGVFIVMFKPFRVNDRLHLQKENLIGIVEDISLRHTVIRNFENRRIIIPNSVISNEVIINSNFTEHKICKIMDIGIAYGADIQKARAIIQEEAMNHGFFMDNRTDEQKASGDPPVSVRVTGWGDFKLNLRVWVWTPDAPSAYVLGCDLYERIKNRFDQEGIEIPYPYRNIVMKEQAGEEQKKV